MTKYDHFEEYVGKLKLAAIDAYMKTHVDNEAYYCTVNEDYYIISYLGTGGTPSSTNSGDRVERPNSKGKGGGKSMKGHHMFEQFDQVRAEIEAIVKPWRSLPDPERISAQMDNCRHLCQVLSVSARSSGGVITGSGVIDDKIASVKDKLNQMSGATINSFSSTFTDKLKASVEGLYVISLILGGSLGSEYQIFKRARYEATKVIEQMASVFESVKTSNSEVVDIILKIAEFALDGFDIFAKGVASKVVSTFKLTIKPVNGLKDNHIREGAADYKEGVELLEKCLNNVSEAIKNSEEAIEENLNHNMRDIYANRDLYDIQADPIESHEVEVKAVNLNQDYVNDIVNTFMPLIAAELDTAKGRTQNVDMSECVNRFSNIGLGMNGPSHSFNNMRWLLYDLLAELAWDTRAATKNFEQAVEYINEHDRNVKYEMDAYANKIKNGSGINPFKPRS